MTFLLIFFSFSKPVLSEPDYNAEDFTFDPKTSTLVAKFMGRVTLLRGQVFAKGAKGNRKLAKGQKIFKNDLVYTKNGLVKIELVDQTVITLNKNSEFNVSDWKYVPQKGERNSVINLLKGQMRTHFKMKARKKNKLEVKVNNVSMGVRGTKILANASSDTQGREITQIALIEGYGRLLDANNDFQKAMNPGDHYISVIGPDGQKTRNEVIPKTEVKKLLAAGKNPKKNFFPFLGNYDIQKMGIKKDSSSKSSTDNLNSIKDTKEEGWKDTMDKLNKRLQENQN